VCYIALKRDQLLLQAAQTAGVLAAVCHTHTALTGAADCTPPAHCLLQRVRVVALTAAAPAAAAAAAQRHCRHVRSLASCLQCCAVKLIRLFADPFRQFCGARRETAGAVCALLVHSGTPVSAAV
jgi:hypothetical protein